MTPLQQRLAARQEVADFIENFGAERATQYLAAGLTFDQAIGVHIDWLKSENEKLARQVAFADQHETKPLSQGGGDLAPQARRQGLEGKINLR